jgi:hypothetical protein
MDSYPGEPFPDHGAGWMTSPAGLLQVQLVKIMTELRAMTPALKMQTTVANNAGSTGH